MKGGERPFCLLGEYWNRPAVLGLHHSVDGGWPTLDKNTSALTDDMECPTNRAC